MDKIKSILASASGKRAGPPVPPRPSKAAVQQALQKTRQQSPVLQSFPKTNPPIIHGRTVVYNSTSIINNEHVDHQPPLNNVSCEIKCFDTKPDDSSTGFITKLVQIGNSARLNRNVNENNNKVVKVDNDAPCVIQHNKSPVARPRSKTPTKLDKIEVRGPQVSTVLINCPSAETNSYANLLNRNQNFPLDVATVKIRTNIKDRDDELKEKLLNEMLDRSNTIGTSNRHLKYNGSNLKRSSSFDVLNESLGEKSSDKKVIFHEMLISELSEMRQHSRLSAAKSSPDISPNGNLNIFEVDDKKSFNTFLSLEDSGVEDEGKMDDCSSSGVGDSWDSCKEMENR